MTDKILVISQKHCGACNTVKEYLEWKQKPFKEQVINEDLSYDDFMKDHAEHADHGTPIVYINDEFVYDPILYFEMN